MYSYLVHLAILILIYSILAVSLDLAVGYTGLLNLGHVAFFGIGAYTSTLLVTDDGVPYLAGIVAAAGLAGFTGWLLAFPTARLEGDYLALATLGFSFIVESLMRNLDSVTRGPLGIPGIPKPSFFGITVESSTAYFVFALVVAGLCIGIMYRLVESRFGRLLEAVRDDEEAAAASGVNVFANKSLALTISAAFAGIAGSLYAHYITFIDPSTFSIHEIILLFSIIIVGGLASWKGAMVGTVIILLLPEPLRFIGLPSSIVGPARQMIYAALLLAIVYYRPKGLFGRVELG